MAGKDTLKELLVESKRLTKAFPDQVGLSLLRVQLLLAAGRADEALAALQTVDEESWACADRDLTAALVALQLGDFSAASRQLRSWGLVEQPQGAGVMLATGMTLLARNCERAADARAGAMLLSGLRSRVFESVVGAVTTLADQAGCAAAQARLEDLLRRFPREPALGACRIDLLVRTGQWQEAGPAEAKKSDRRISF